MEKQILIIGGGLAGLTLAYRLEQASIAYYLIEARARFGGRIHTIRTMSGNTIEMGATWFADKHQNLVSLLKELNLPYENQYMGQKSIYDYHNGERVVQTIDLPSALESNYILSNGSSDLINSLSDRLDQSRICLGEKIQSLSYSKGRWVVDTSKRSLEVDLVVNTLPPNLFVNTIEIEPELPSDMVAISKQTHTWMGESIKVGVELENAAWKQQAIGSFFSQFGPLTELHDHSHNGMDSAILKGFTAPFFREFPDEEKKQLIKEQINLYLPRIESKLVEYHELDWQKEVCTYHQYDGEVLPHQNNGNQLLRKPLFEGHLIIAGSETARTFPGYMDGAVERAEEVAQQIIAMNQ